MAEVTGKRINIRFEGYPDVLIVARSTSLGTLLEVGNAMAGLNLEDLASLDVGVASKVLRDSLELFLSCVVGWNLEVRNAAGDLVAVPVTIEGVLSLPDPELVLRAVAHWRDAQVKPPAPLPSPSGSGATWQEGNIPMAPR